MLRIARGLLAEYGGLTGACVAVHGLNRGWGAPTGKFDAAMGGVFEGAAIGVVASVLSAGVMAVVGASPLVWRGLVDRQWPGKLPVAKTLVCAAFIAVPVCGFAMRLFKCTADELFESVTKAVSVYVLITFVRRAPK